MQESESQILLQPPHALTLVPMGRVRSPLVTAVGSPLQPRHAGGVTGTVEIDPSLMEGLQDLEGFERLWLLYWFHLASPAELTPIPYRDVVPRGVFATRVPARPNPLGLSCVRLLAIHGSVLEVGELDLLDGTPILDIKPYVPEYDAYPSARAGWLDQSNPRRGEARGDGRFERKE